MSIATRWGLALVLAASGSACDRTDADESPPEAEAATQKSDAGSGAQTVTAPEKADPKLEAAGEAADIDAVTPGVYWLRTSGALEVMYAIGADAWRFDVGPNGSTLHPGGAARLAARLGLGDGDVIERVGKVDLTSGFEARDVYDELASGEGVLVILLRNGTPRRQVYRVTDARDLGDPGRSLVVDDIVALAVQDDPWRVERAVLVAIDKATEREAETIATALARRVGLPTEPLAWTVDGQSVPVDGLAGALARRRDAAKVDIGADKATVQLQIVSSTIDANDLAGNAPSTVRSPLDPPDVDGSAREPVVPSTDDWSSADTADEHEAVERVSDGHYRFSRKALQDILADPAAAAKSCRIVPSQRDGVTEGYKLYGIRATVPEGAIPVRALGFKNGDMITEINGNALSSMEAALETYAKVRKLDKLEVTVVRKGKSHEIEIELTK